MKPVPFFLSCLILASSCSSYTSFRTPSSERPFEFEKYVDGDDKERAKVITNNPEYVHPDLKAKVGDDELLAQMQKRLDDLSIIVMEDVKPAKLDSSDYVYAKIALQIEITKAIQEYYKNLALIEKKMRRNFSQYLAMRDEIVNLGESGEFLQKELERSLKFDIPALNTEINSLYAKSIQGLVTLNGKGGLPVRGSGSKYKNQLKVKFDIGSDHLLEMCISRMCYSRLAGDLMNWSTFAMNLNRDIDFVNYDMSKRVWTASSVKSSPFITLAVIKAADEMISFKIKENKDYTLAGVIAKQIGNTVSSGAGVVVGVTVAPIFAVEKLGIAVAQLLTTKVMRLELKLNKLDAWDDNVVKEGFLKEIAKITEGLPGALFEEESSASKEKFLRVLVKRYGATCLDYLSKSDQAYVKSMKESREEVRSAAPCGLSGSIEYRIKDCSEKKEGFVLLSRNNKLEEVYKEIKTGIIWSDRVSNNVDPFGSGNMNYLTAVELCKSSTTEVGESNVTWRLPSKKDFKNAEKSGIRKALPNMNKHGFWFSGSNSRNVYYGGNGVFGVQSEYVFHSLRCVTN